MKPTTIISVYHVYKHPTNQDGSSAWSEQKTLLLECNQKEHPNKAYMKDLESLWNNVKAKDIMS